MITVNFVQKEILKELLQMYVKSLFVENCFSSLFYYINSKFGQYSVDYYWAILKDKISFEDFNKILTILSSDDFENQSKQAIQDVLESTNEKIDALQNILNNISVSQCLKINIIEFENDRNIKFGEKNDNKFFLEYYINVPKNSLNLNDFNLQDVVNIDELISFINTQNEQDILNNFKNLKFGLRLCYNMGNINGIDPGNIAKLKKSYQILDPNGQIYYPIPVCVAELDISYLSITDLTQQLQDETIINNNIQNLKLNILNMDDYQVLFTQVIPADCLDTIFACQFHKTSKIFKKVLDDNKFYLNSSRNIMNTIDKLINYKEAS